MAGQSRLIKVPVAGHEAALTLCNCPDLEAPAVVALHGFTGCGEDFLPLQESSKEKDFHWILIDFMGHGKSDSPENLDPYLLVNALFLIDRARSLAPDPERVCLLGYSMGARLALNYLKWARPLPAILIGANPGIEDPAERAIRRLDDAQWLAGPEASVADFCDRWEEQPLIKPQTRLSEPLRSVLAGRRRRNDPAGLRNTLLALGSGVLPSRWKDLGQLPPALCVYGDKDEKFRQIARTMQAKNPSMELAEVPGCGHAPHLEAPDSVASLLGNFVLSR